MNSFNANLLKRFNGVSLDVSLLNKAPKEEHDAFVLAAASMGFALDGKLMDQIYQCNSRQLKDLFLLLSENVGGGVRFRPLFAKFPFKVPDQRDYWVNRVIGHLETIFGIHADDCTLLSCGHYIDHRKFDLSEFGACPICQMQVPELTGTASYKESDFQKFTPLRVITHLSTNDLWVCFESLVQSKTSVSPVEMALLQDLSQKLDLSTWVPPEECYKELLPFVAKIVVPYSYGVKYLEGQISGATDLLRIATFFSNPEGDVSLSTNTKFKLTSSQRTLIMQLLSTCKSLEEDLLRHREKWLRVAQLLHPMSAKNRRKYPEVGRAFDVLRNTPEKIQTFNRSIETAIRRGLVGFPTVRLLSTRPGEFARRLDVVLRNYAHDINDVVREFEMVVDQTKILPLMQLVCHFRQRNSGHDRYFVPKGKMTALQVVTDTRNPIEDDVCRELIRIIENSIINRMKSLPPLGAVLIDNDWSNIVLPFNSRGDSDSSTYVTKGSHISLNTDDVVRLFMYWHESDKSGRVDLDLSLMYFDDNWRQRGQVSWTNLRDNLQTVHSGDIQSAPHGAAEFIDFNVSGFRNAGIRYVAMQVRSFTGQPFGQYEAFAGFMERDSFRSGAAFEPASVALKFTVKSDAREVMPLVVDTFNKKVIWADVSLSGRAFGSISGDSKKLVAFGKVITDMIVTKPTMGDLITYACAARATKMDFQGDPADYDHHISKNYDVKTLMALLIP